MFLFKDTATTEIYNLTLPAALPSFFFPSGVFDPKMSKGDGPKISCISSPITPGVGQIVFGAERGQRMRETGCAGAAGAWLRNRDGS